MLVISGSEYWAWIVCILVMIYAMSFFLILDISSFEYCFLAHLDSILSRCFLIHMDFLWIKDSIIGILVRLGARTMSQRVGSMMSATERRSLRMRVYQENAILSSSSCATSWTLLVWGIKARCSFSELASILKCSWSELCNFLSYWWSMNR